MNMFMLEYKDLGWWYWLLTVILLTIGVAGNATGFLLAIGLTVFQLIHFAIREGGISSFPVQVRFCYLLLLLLAWIEPMQWLYWIPTIGTWAQIVFGYCTMARLVSLFPWNRSEPFSFDMLVQTFLSPPVRCSIKQGFEALE